MSEPIPSNGLSPLDQIRLIEAEITRKIIAAREASERAVAEARHQANLLKKKAHESGIRAGQIRHKETVAQAEEEGKAIIAGARQYALHLRQRGEARMEMAVQEAVQITIGLKGNGASNEPSDDAHRNRGTESGSTARHPNAEAVRLRADRGTE